MKGVTVARRSIFSLASLLVGVSLASPGHAQENDSTAPTPAGQQAAVTDEAPAAETQASALSAEQAAAGHKTVARSHVVKFVSSPGVAFYESAREQTSRTRLCLAPCTLDLEGQHTFALGLNGGDPVAAPETLELDPHTVVEGEYQSNSGSRHAGWVVLGIGVPVGLAAVTTGLLMTSNNSPDSPKIGFGTAAGGGIVTLVSLVVGLMLTLSSDEAHVHSRPASSAGI
jgi:hypothetical protein